MLLLQIENFDDITNLYLTNKIIKN